VTDVGDSGVDVDSELLHALVGGIDVAGVEDDSCADTHGIWSRRYERKPSRSARGVDLDPSVTIGPGKVGPDFEAEQFVEREGPGLVGRRDGHELHKVDPE
jgi:hypothetical protein